MLSLGGIARAEEPVKAPAGEGIILAHLGQRDNASFEPSQLESKEGIRLSDEELGLITGQALVTDSPEISVSTDSRIILWDEVKTNANGAINQGGGQSITTISTR